MRLCLSLEEITPAMAAVVGGKALALAALWRRDYPLPASLSISVEAYRRYLHGTGLDARLVMELGRKDFQQMRWEELWDASLRIRNLFLVTDLPAAMAAELGGELERVFGDRPVAVRSSAPCEDSAHSSFAGLHDSFVNVRGTGQLLLAVRKVWASLWSDRALLYRQELGLDIQTSAMAVLVQELVVGEKSGVAFSRSPAEPERVAVEAVWGLNQGLVDGSVEPDFWSLDRRGETIAEFRAASRKLKLAPLADGLQAVPLSSKERLSPPLSDPEVRHVAQVALALEKAMAQPQDVEWTWSGSDLILLQSRPITTGQESADASRGWYLSLHRSLENLKELRRRIEEEILPAMESEARSLAGIELRTLSDAVLAAEIERRRRILAEWEAVYRSDCIPMAHGVRLFGEFYNDALEPANPFEFVELLRGQGFRALHRNRELVALAEAARSDAGLMRALQKGDDGLPGNVTEGIGRLAEVTGLLPAQVARLAAQLAQHPARSANGPDPALEKAYFDHFADRSRDRAAEVLEIGRASYRLRDDDNLSLAKIVRELERAEQEGRRRLEQEAAAVLKALFAGEAVEPAGKLSHVARGQLRVRQLQGQPASPGLATAPARVVGTKQDLAEFCAGEILVCDALDPAMTFVVPLAAGIVERRGGMLIHGAIIAREYGIPCVTGIPEAATLIRNGDRITLDGYLGIVFFPPSAGSIATGGATVPARPDLDDALRR